MDRSPEASPFRDQARRDEQCHSDLATPDAKSLSIQAQTPGDASHVRLKQLSKDLSRLELKDGHGNDACTSHALDQFHDSPHGSPHRTEASSHCDADESQVTSPVRLLIQVSEPPVNLHVGLKDESEKQSWKVRCPAGGIGSSKVP